MKSCLGTIIAIIIAIVLFSNIGKIIDIGNAIVDKAYEMVVTDK